MNRIFHARVPWYAFLLLILLAVLVVWSYWERIGLLVAGALMMMVFVIERIIHTAYTVSDRELIVERGRFSARIVIPLISIRSIERVRSAQIGSVCLKRYLLVYYVTDGEKTISLIPSMEDEMVKYITRQRDKQKVKQQCDELL